MVEPHRGATIGYIRQLGCLKFGPGGTRDISRCVELRSGGTTGLIGERKALRQEREKGSKTPLSRFLCQMYLTKGSAHRIPPCLAATFPRILAESLLFGGVPFGDGCSGVPVQARRPKR